MQFCPKIHCLGKVLPRDLKALSAMRRIHQVPKTLSKKYLRDTFLYTPGQQEDEEEEEERERATREKFENFLRLPKKELLLLRTSGLVEAELATKVSICGLTCGLHHDKPGFFLSILSHMFCYEFCRSSFEE